MLAVYRHKHSNVINLGVTVPDLTKFPRNVEKSLSFDPLKLELRSAIRFGTPERQMTIGQIRKFGPKCCCHRNVSYAIANE